MACRACLGPVVPVVDLGQQPAGGGYPLADDPPDVRLPLRLGTCQSCGLAQLVDPSPPEADEPDSPSPLSSATMAQHARTFVDDLATRGLLDRSPRILSVASHGGHLAPFLVERGRSATILDASPGRAARLSGGALPALVGELDAAALPSGLEPGSFDLVIDNYLLAHLEHPRAAVERMAALLAPGGTLVVEFDHLLAKVQGGQWDAIRHGHRSYLSIGWLSREFAALGLGVMDAVSQPVYGGALRVFARAAAGIGEPVQALLAREGAAAIDRAAGLAPLEQALDRARREVAGHLRDARASGRLVAGYGAPARSVTFLNAVGIGPDLLPYVVDRAVAKQGRMIPGVRIPIRSPEALSSEGPDEVLILTWDLAAEVVTSLAANPALARTRFVVAVPRLMDAPGAAVGP
jgi:SAM-dependent methyltransferase